MVKKSKCILLKKYKGHRIEKCRGIIEVVKGTSRFIVALDDSKLSGHRIFFKDANNIKSAKNYIDWVTK